MARLKCPVCLSTNVGIEALAWTTFSPAGEVVRLPEFTRALHRNSMTPNERQTAICLDCGYDWRLDNSQLEELRKWYPLSH